MNLDYSGAMFLGLIGVIINLVGWPQVWDNQFLRLLGLGYQVIALIILTILLYKRVRNKK